MSLLLLVFAQGDVLEFTCDRRYFPDPDCLYLIPYCRAFTAQRIDGDLYRLVCKICEEGFEPTEGAEVEFSPSTRSPKSETLLCRRDYALAPIYTSISARSRGELQYCTRYTVSEIDLEANTGRFTCIECEGNLYHTPVTGGVIGSLDPSVRKTVCTRNVGEYECGTLCRTEFPGCERFKIFDRRFDKKATESQEKWRAKVQCLKPIANYMPKMRIEEYLIDSIYTTKDLVVPAYESAATSCSDPLCKLLLPKCDVYYWVADNPEAPTYTCLQCSSGYRPKPYGVKGKPYADLISQAESLPLCDLEPTTSMRILDEGWMREFPGCDSVTVTKVYDSLSGQRAVYNCDYCGEGYEAVEAEHDLPVFTNPPTPKYLCRPIQGDSFECTNECRFKLPWCRRFATRYFPPSPDSTKIMFKCVECDAGFTPVQDQWTLPQIYDWVVQYDVCEHIPTPEPVPCDTECQAVFPQCEVISIKRDSEKKDTYRCHQCAQGFFPMDYEDEARGMISNPKNRLRESSEIHLCARDEDIILIDKYDFRLTQNKDRLSKIIQAVNFNCNLLGMSFNLNTQQSDSFCLECQPGYTNVPRKSKAYYQIDWSDCVKTELVTKQ